MLATALAATLNLDARFIGAMACAPAAASRRRRALLGYSTYSTISFELAVPDDAEYLTRAGFGSVTDADSLARAVSAALRAAVDDGTLASAIAAAATSLGVASMLSVTATGVAVVFSAGADVLASLACTDASVVLQR